jgi:isopenicillin-N N-acyltransferase-like protein
VSVRVAEVSGGPDDRGRAVGRAFAEPIARSLDFYRGFLERRGVRTADLPRMLGPYRDAAARAVPELMAELDGVAAGADASRWELFAANAFEELESHLAVSAPADRCTVFAVAGPEGTILAHNELWYAGDGENVGVVVARPDEGPAFVSPTVVTALPAVGMNSAGVAQGIMSLTADDDGVGIPRVLVSRHALQASGGDDVVRRATLPNRSGGYAYVVAERGGRRFSVETSATAHALLDEAAHTNHYLDPDLAARGQTSVSSEVRLARLRTMLEERRPTTVEEAMDILSDHGSSPTTICLHDGGSEGDEADATLFAMVCHVEDRRMWVASGNPCTEPFEEIDLEGALS